MISYLKDVDATLFQAAYLAKNNQGSGKAKCIPC